MAALWKTGLSLMLLGMRGKAAVTLTPPVIALCDVGQSVTMTFEVPSPGENHIVIGKNGTEVTTLVDDGSENHATDFRDRIKNLQYKNGSGNFDLTNVSRSDAGMYECHQGSLIGKPIRNCGLTLVCVDFIRTYVNASQPIIAGGHVTLTCSVTSSPEIPDHKHQNLHYSWFKDGTILDKQAGRQAMLGPLTQTDQGNFTCCPCIDKGLCLPLETTEAFPLLLAADQNGNNPDLVIGLTVGAVVLVLVVVVVVVVYVCRRRKVSKQKRPPAGKGGNDVPNGTELHLLENGNGEAERNGVAWVQ